LFQAVITAASTMRSKGDKVLVPLLPTLLGLPYPEHCEDTVLADQLQKAFSYSQTDEGRSAFQEIFCRQAYELWPERGKRLNRRNWQLEWPEDLMTAASRIYDGWHELVVRQMVLHSVQFDAYILACMWQPELHNSMKPVVEFDMHCLRGSS
jgi:hypothetical protein